MLAVKHRDTEAQRKGGIYLFASVSLWVIPFFSRVDYGSSERNFTLNRSDFDRRPDPCHHSPAGRQNTKSGHGLADVQPRSGWNPVFGAQTNHRGQCFETEARMEHAVSRRSKWPGSGRSG